MNKENKNAFSTIVGTGIAQDLSGMGMDEENLGISDEEWNKPRNHRQSYRFHRKVRYLINKRRFMRQSQTASIKEYARGMHNN